MEESNGIEVTPNETIIADFISQKFKRVSLPEDSYIVHVFNAHKNHTIRTP